jgi:ribosomal protein S6
MLAKPQTYMNLSGASLAPLMEKHSIGPERLVVVYDELDLGWKALRIKPKGSAAGHKGMKSVIGSLGTSEIVRVRLGIHPGHPVKDGAEFVLAPFGRSQIKELDEFVGYAADAVRSIIAEGVEKAMTRFNRRAPGLNHRGSMRIYEELFIVKPDAPEEEVDQFVEQLRTQLTTAGATVDKIDKWGKRRLAYRVDKYREGTYVLFQFTAGPETVKELERRLRVAGHGHEVPDRAHRRDAETAGQAEEGARQAGGQARRQSRRPHRRRSRARRRDPDFSATWTEAPAMPGLPKES